jgi:hypothetical protein
MKGGHWGAVARLCYWLLAAGLGLTLAGGPAVAQDRDPATERQIVVAGQVLLQQKQYRPLIELIKTLAPQLSSSPESRDLSVLLAAAYVGENNAFWAIRTLAPRLEAEPDDCELRLWLAWAYFHVPQIDHAREVLEHPSCRVPGPQAARASLLGALMAKTEGKEPAAREDLAQAWAAKEMYPADRAALPALTQQIDPDQIPELSWKVDARLGWTSNGLLGSPTDPTAGADTTNTRSRYYQIAGWFRLSPRLRLPLRPALEGEVRTFQLANPAISAQSYIDLTGRLGVFVGSRLPRLFVAYRPEFLRLAGGDLETTGANWYLSAHRAEAELELKPWLLVFAGGGRRDFRPMIRDRYELDGGLGGQVSLLSRLSMVWAASGRKHWSDSGTYDLLGGTALANLFYDFNLGLQARAGATLAGDSYPHWNGHLDLIESKGSRRDVFVKGTAALWSPVVSGLRLGVLYEYSHRDSTAPLFIFSDHRVSALLTWSGSTTLSRPKRASSAPVADVAWDLGDANGALKERVQDYLREDERTLQRSCGCRE